MTTTIQAPPRAATPTGPRRPRQRIREWQEQGLCRETDPEVFSPGDDGTYNPRAAKAICHLCPVKIECGLRALEDREPHGVLGGTTWHERERIIRLPQRTWVRLIAMRDDARRRALAALLPNTHT